MNFEIYLRYPQSILVAKNGFIYSPKEREVVWEMCRILACTNDIEFCVTGILIPYMGKMVGIGLSTDWDLACFLEQLPDVMKKMSGNDYNFRIDFYEQGSSFYLQFTSDNSEIVDVTYHSYFSDVTCCANTTKSELKYMLKKIYSNFIFLSTTICGYLYNYEDFSLRSLLSIKKYL